MKGSSYLLIAAIIITTKKGSEGKSTLTFTQSLTFDRPNQLPEQQRLFAQGEVVGETPSYRGPLESNRSWGPRLDTLRYDGDASAQFSQLGRIVGQSDPTATGQPVEPFDNPGDFFQTGITSNTHLSVAGGNGQTSYYVSGGYLKQTGIVPNADYQRITFKVSGDTRLSEKLKIGGSMNYIHSGGDRMQRGILLSR